ncbi:NUDIX domain-containing protein [Pararhodonellum marinum]|uniref:NUDIX domain-containing protein n=1 Tax=Pararhodonellum marinum TaxID=2755358 RepID=UPI00188E16FA|nr:NUDIX hydrolase [Pararhodonellum marinum]
MAHTYDYPRPSLTADAIVYCMDTKEVLLIKRKNEPFHGKWALPGGFVDPYEIPFQACLRELKEETALELYGHPEILVGVYGQEGRDPRGWTVSVVYFFEVLETTKSKVQEGSDSSEVGWFEWIALPELAFDHLEILGNVQA